MIWFSSTWRLLALVFAIVLAVFGVHCLSVARGIKRRFPDLVDESPGVDFYWPDVVHLVNNFIASTLFVIAFIIVAVALFWPKRKRQSEESSTTD